MNKGAKTDFDSLIKLVGNVMDSFTASFFTYDDSSDELSLYSFFSLSGNINPNTKVKSGEGMLGWVAKERKPISVKDFTHDSTTLKLYTKKEDIKTFLAVPVMEEDDFIGVLALDSKRQYVFAPKDKKILEDFAAAFARTAIRYKRKEELKKEAANIKALDKIVSELSSSEDIVSIVKTLFNKVENLIQGTQLVFAFKSTKEGAFHLIKEPEEGDTDINKIPLRLDESLIGWVIKKNKPLIHPDLNEHTDKHGLEAAVHRREGYRSFLGVPMVVRRHVIGALALLGKERNAYGRREERILSILGAIAASHVASSYAYDVSLATRKVDYLTGLGNYIYMQEKIEEPASAPGALLSLDICNFRNITNEFSVKTADTVLIELANFFKRILRDEGYLARYYGDVFLLYLPQHDKDEAQNAARKLLDILKAKKFFIDERELAFECKVGIAFYPDDADNGDDLIKRSFEALKTAQSRKEGKTISPIAVFNSTIKTASK